MEDPKLLLVDDDPGTIQVLSRMLAGYENLRFATSGADALRLAREAAPDLILLDAEMPGMSGFEVYKSLKADPLLAVVPVIFATSNLQAAMEAAALEAGTVDFVPKPLVAAQVLARVQAQLARRPRAEPPDPDAVGGDGVVRLLIVDADAQAAQAARHALAASGECLVATDADEALRLARDARPDAILVDVDLPGSGGLELCRRLRADPALAQVPLVVVSQQADARLETQAFDTGAADFVAKPYMPAVLRARVGKLLRSRRQVDADLHALREHWRRLGDSRVSDIVAAASDAIVTFDARGEVVLINAAACSMFHTGAEQMMGRPVETLIPASLRAAHGWDDAVFAPRDTVSAARALKHLQALRADGKAFPVEVSLSHLGEGADRLSTMMLRDVTERDRAEAETRARIEAEAASHAKTLMLSYIAHEIGNPLSGILGFAHLMANDIAEPLPPGQARRLEQIELSGRLLQTLMRDVLDVSRFEIGSFEIDRRPVDVAACAERALAAVAAQAEQAGIGLRLLQPAAGRIVGDADRLHQCLVNLLLNAIKYNRRGGHVEMAARTEGATATIDVRDDGLGMDEAQQAALFEPFNRLGRGASSTAGNGIGLLLTRQLVAAMDGSISVDSQPNRGSCFRLTFASV